MKIWFLYGYITHICSENIHSYIPSPIPTDPPQIRSVTFQQNGTLQNRVVANTRVDIVCDFDLGNPKTLLTPRLTREDGRDLEPVTKTRPHRLVHTIRSVTCNDAGNVTCHGLGQAKSAELIVLCKYVRVKVWAPFDQVWYDDEYACI